MFTELKVFKLAHAMASHAGRRQAVVAQNMANSDTPGYAARDISSFADLIGKAGATTMHQTRPAHFSEFAKDAAQGSVGAVHRGSNTVSIEEEMLKAVEVTRQHDRALAIYKSSLSILRSSLGQT
ncbi:FlgB family protein [Pontibaca salina]|uniref:FlgB family protein n=1 Tax=Pontibaca salina TaxID=2795731 RepID=A0A934M317_9RHOB|nr:FlgB family protein [Pontibaca salina]MBI6629384.1 FlgB family protein [Pontibaca salina]